MNKEEQKQKPAEKATEISPLPEEVKGWFYFRNKINELVNVVNELRQRVEEGR